MHWLNYERLANDGMIQWHPAFLKLGNTLEEGRVADLRGFENLGGLGFQQKSLPKQMLSTRKAQLPSLSGIIVTTKK
jgi:hypothetical protein